MPKAKEFPKPSRPMVEPILSIHRGAESYLRLLNKDADGAVHSVASVKVMDLDTMFPSFVEELLRDSFYTVNSFWRPGTHASKDARYLNACYADLDFGKGDGDIKFGQAMKVITELQDQGVIPPASIIVRSGHGGWLFWILSDEKNNRLPPEAFPEKQVEYMAVQRALGERLRSTAPELKPDAGAVDVSRITRVPGSFHTGAKRRVSYLAQFDDTMPSRIDWEDGFAWLRAPLFTYTLRELGKWTGVDARPRAQVTRTKSTGKAPNRIRGWQAISQRRFEEYQKLEQHRDGWREGNRHQALYVGALMMRQLGWDEPKVEYELERVALRCHPPMDEWRDALRDNLVVQKGEHRRIRDETLVGYLQTTTDETEALGLHHLRFDAKWKPFIAKGAKARRDQRREALAELLVQFDTHRPTVEEVRHVLAEKYELKAAGATVWKDAQAVGFDFTRAKPGPITEQSQLEF